LRSAVFSEAHRESVPQTAAVAVCVFSRIPRQKRRGPQKRRSALRTMRLGCDRKDADRRNGGPRYAKKCLKCLIRLHPRFPLCYAEAAMKTKDCNRPQKPHRCRSPKLTPARLAACRANARKWVAQTAAVAVCGCSDAHRDFVAQTAVVAVCGLSPSPGEKTRTANAAVRATNDASGLRPKRRGPQKRRSALPSGEERMKTNRRSVRNSGSYEDNLRFPIWIQGHARACTSRMTRSKFFLIKKFQPGNAERYIWLLNRYHPFKKDGCCGKVEATIGERAASNPIG